MTLTFRPYLPADREACMAVFMSNTPQYFAVEEAPDFQSFLERRPCPYFVVLQNEQVVACGGYGVDPAKNTIVLAWGMVHADLHKQNIGSFMLVERLKAIHQEHGESVIQIDTSQYSKGFFARHGFQETGFTENYYAPGLHRVDMELKLTARPQ